MENNLLENEPHEENAKARTKRVNVLTVLQYIILILIIIFLVLVSFLYYLSFAGILSLTVYLLLYEWLSLFTKDILHMVLSIFANFSDFGLFFVLALLCVYVIKAYLSFLQLGFKLILPIFSRKVIISDNYDKDTFFNGLLICNLIIIAIIIAGLIVLFIFIFKNQMRLFIAAISLECIFLVLVFLGNLCIFVQKIVQKFKKKDPTELSTSLLTPEGYPDIDLQINGHRKSDTKKTDFQYENKQPSENHDNSKLNGNTNLNVDSKLNDNSNLNDHSNLNNVNNVNNIKLANKGSNNSYTKLNDSTDKGSVTLQQLQNENIFFVSSLYGMFDDSIEGGTISKCQIVYQSIIMAIILSFQMYSLIYPCINGSITIGQFFLYFFIKLIFINKIFAYNFIDIILNGKRVIRSLKQMKAKIIFWIVVILYIALIVAFTVILLLSQKAVFPTIKSATFTENNQRWYKLNKNQAAAPESFCFTHAQKDGTLKTEDFAMLTTLPRMYNVTKDGKCFIKPSMRGLFNTTMKYIFGKDYEKDGIFILCKRLTRYPILVISSEKILNKTLDYFSNDNNIKFLNKQFNVTNTNYFENRKFTNLTIEGRQLLNDYEKCVELNGTENCEEKWDIFTQFYWPNMYSNDYVDINGFERYQISIDSKMTIQPSFITSDGQLWSGTHYIVSGSCEDGWGVGFFIETIGRKYIPLIFNNILILYSLTRDILNEVFLRIEWFNRNIFYFDVSSSKEMSAIVDLYSQFNFSHQALYTIGHSISGTAFKGVSYFTDIQGIAFEASDGENNVNLLLNSKFTKKSDANSQITNVYSKNSIISGNDGNCDVNGILPRRYIFPNVFDTACQAAISCSNTMKYVPFCKQVLTQNGENPEKEFNISFKAYMNYYGYTYNDS